MIVSMQDFVETAVAIAKACQREFAQAQEEAARKVEAEGYRIVDGGQTDSYSDADGKCPCEVRDWRTNELLLSGRYNLEGFDAASDERMAADSKPWFDISNLEFEDLLPPEFSTLGYTNRDLVGRISDFGDEFERIPPR